ncbi:MAG: phosphate acyltransferase PlsX [Clostridia bacterium]|nr:phosphate acyltransferase PlsX [Clostridia bacterium]
MIRIAVDAMGGDFAPAEQVAGAVEALKKHEDLHLILVGDKALIEEQLQALGYDGKRVEIVHTTEVITMEDEPAKAVKTKKDSSLVVAFNLLKDGVADGLVSSGSTGAVLTAGVLRLGRIKGISRPALCPAIPNYQGGVTLLCDCGANLECKPVNLMHFAMMATAYGQAVFGMQNPRVGLLNNGTEDHKGLELHREVNELLKHTPCVNYVGNREGRELMYGDVDVMVSDGFTGNIAMKSVEGCGKAVSSIMKREYKRNMFTMLSALVSKGVINKIRKSLDYEGVGGAMLLGLHKAVVKGHGNSKKKAFSVCITQAYNAAKEGMVDKIKAMLEQVQADGEQA